MFFFQCWSCRGSRASGHSSQDLAAALDSLATVATLAAGFVMYNITTYNTAPYYIRYHSRCRLCGYDV